MVTVFLNLKEKIKPIKKSNFIILHAYFVKEGFYIEYEFKI